MIRNVLLFLRELSWSAVFAVGLSALAVFGAVSNWNLENLIALGGAAITLAIISTRD